MHHSTLGSRVIKREGAGLPGERGIVSRGRDGPGAERPSEHRPRDPPHPLLVRKADVRLPGKGNSNSHGAGPVHLIITMIKWIRMIVGTEKGPGNYTHLRYLAPACGTTGVSQVD